MLFYDISTILICVVKSNVNVSVYSFVLDYDEIFNVIKKLYKSALPEDQHDDDWDPQHAADIIASKARACWPSEYRDDITCCVIKLKDSSGPLFL